MFEIIKRAPASYRKHGFWGFVKVASIYFLRELLRTALKCILFLIAHKLSRDAEAFNFITKKTTDICVGYARYLCKTQLQRRFQREMVIEVTNICNARCIFCPYGHDTREKGFLSDTNFERALELSTALNIQAFDFTPKTGDSFLDRRFLDRAASVRCAFPKAKIRLYTNGIAMNRCDFNDIITSGLDEITVSLGLTPKEYSMLFGVAKYEQVVQNVNGLAEANGRFGQPLRIYLLFHTNQPMADLVSSSALDKWQSFCDEFGCLMGINSEYCDIRGANKDPRLNYAPPSNTDFRIIQRFAPCGSLSKIGVAYDGRLYACYCVTTGSLAGCLHEFEIGHISCENLDINENLSTLMSNWRQGLIPTACRSCRNYKPVVIPFKGYGVQ